MSKKKFEFILSVKEKGFSSFKTAGAGMSAFNREVKTGKAGVVDLNSKLGVLTSTFLGFTGVLGAGIGISSLVTGVVGAEKQLDNMARTAGASVGDFQAYAFGLQSVGLEADKLADLSKDLKDKIGDFIETGGGEFADFFENVAEKAGLTAEELIKLSGPDALIAIKKGLDDANVSAEKQVFYMEALANDASLLIPLLENNGESWKKLAAQAKEMGVVISDLDSKQLLELSKTMAELTLHMGVARREIVLALAPSLKEMATYFTENKDELKQFVVALAEGAGEIAQFVIENRELIVTLTKIVAGTYVAVKGYNLLTTSIRAVTAASIAMTGASAAAAVGRLGAGAATAGAAVLGVVGPVGLVTAATVLLTVATVKLIERNKKMKQLNADNAAKQEASAASAKKLAKQFREISKATGLEITSIKKRDKAIADGLVVFNKATGEWVGLYGKISAGAEKSANKQKQVQGKALVEMKKKYEQYVDEIKSLQDKIVGREQSLYEQLRNIDRTGMSDVDAWEDLKKEAEEYRETAEIAAEAGSFDMAIEYADKARAKYAELNTEIEGISPQDVLKIVSEGVEASGKIALESLGEQQKAAKEAMEALTEESGWQDLATSMDDAKKTWMDNWSAMQVQAIKDIDKVKRALDKIVKDQDVYVNVHTVEKKSTGGLAGVMHFAKGGSPSQVLQKFTRLTNPYITSGGGVKDDVPAMLKRREYVQPTEAVDYYGVRFMEMIRRRLLPKPMGFAAGGTPAGPVSLAGLSTGSGAGFVLNNPSFHFADSGVGSSRHSAKQQARLVMDELQKLYKGSSKF